MSADNPSPEIVAAFMAWRDAELAGHYMAPCPDEVMNASIKDASEKLRALAAMPARCAADVLLKMLPVAIIEHDPYAWEPPLGPVVRRQEESDYDEDALWEGIIADMARVSPLIAEAMKQPASEHYRAREAAFKAKKGLTQ